MTGVFSGRITVLTDISSIEAIVHNVADPELEAAFGRIIRQDRELLRSLADVYCLIDKNEERTPPYSLGPDLIKDLDSLILALVLAREDYRLEQLVSFLSRIRSKGGGITLICLDTLTIRRPDLAELLTNERVSATLSAEEG